MYFQLIKTPTLGTIKLDIPEGMEIKSYDIDVLGRKVFYITDEGLYSYDWGLGKADEDTTTKLWSHFTSCGKIRFDNVGKILYVLQPAGIYITVHPYKDFHRIIDIVSISNYEIIPEIGYYLYITEY